ncbi:tyrosine-type recombinase/integrase [Chloroflexota bacterium]
MNGDESPLSGSSMENIWKAIRSFFRWASEEIEIERPDLNLVKPEYSAPEIIPYTEIEFKLLLKACDFTAESNGRRIPFKMKRPSGKRDRAIVLVLLDTGIRASEIARVELADVNFQTGAILIAPFGSGRKTKSRTVYMGKAARSALWLYVAERNDIEGVLFRTVRGRPMNRNSIRQMVNSLGERAGVRNAYPHRFRHTFAIQFLRNGGDIFSLQRLLGHASLEMVQKYLKLAEVDTQNAHRRASPVDRWGL